MKFEYIGKCLLIKGENKVNLVIGDLHLGYVGSMRESGVLVPSGMYDEMIKEFDEIFLRVGKVNRVILLGDLKHEFGRILREEWKEVLDFLNYLGNKSEEIIIVKGNHDAIVDNILKKKDIKSVDYFILKDVVFLHGNKDFPAIYNKEIKTWIVGHGHPAIVLQERKGSKKEKYKCFLIGKYEGRKVVIVPSFFGLNEGSDISGSSGKELGLAWDLNLNGFEVKIVNEQDLEVLDFGKLSRIKN